MTKMVSLFLICSFVIPNDPLLAVPPGQPSQSIVGKQQDMEVDIVVKTQGGEMSELLPKQEKAEAHHSKVVEDKFEKFVAVKRKLDQAAFASPSKRLSVITFNTPKKNVQPELPFEPSPAKVGLLRQLVI